MKLTKAQSKKFIIWYKERYGDITKWLPEIYESEEVREEKVRQAFIIKLMWAQGKKLHKHRNRGRETINKKVFNSLWLEFWPACIPDPIVSILADNIEIDE